MSSSFALIATGALMSVF
jgi:NADH-quinone oxidoreductase subunit J